MKITFLGTGTSSGIPVIACDCRVCASTDPRNKRRRTSLYIQAAGMHLVVDTPPDFREQALTARIPRVDAVLVTHSHADHILGLDDIRRYNTIQNATIPVYASPGASRDLVRIFDYVRSPVIPAGTYRPKLDFIEVTGVFRVGLVRIEPLKVVHGMADTLGYRVDADGRTLGYVPDCKTMPDKVVERLAGVDVMILDTLRHKAHSTHLTVDESAALLRRIGARRSLVVHMCHDLDHAELERELGPAVEISYDGLTLEW